MHLVSRCVFQLSVASSITFLSTNAAAVAVLHRSNQHQSLLRPHPSCSTRSCWPSPFHWHLESPFISIPPQKIVLSCPSASSSMWWTLVSLSRRAASAIAGSSHILSLASIVPHTKDATLTRSSSGAACSSCSTSAPARCSSYSQALSSSCRSLLPPNLPAARPPPSHPTILVTLAQNSTSAGNLSVDHLATSVQRQLQVSFLVFYEL